MKGFDDATVFNRKDDVMTFDEVKEAMMAQIFAKFTDEEMAEICSTANCKRRFRELGWSKPVSTISEELFAKKAFLRS